MNLTENEIKMMENLAFNDFGYEFGDPTWSRCLSDGPHGEFVNKSSFGGIIASLVKKGLANVSGSGPDSITYLTEDGVKELGLSGKDKYREEPSYVSWNEYLEKKKKKELDKYFVL